MHWIVGDIHGMFAPLQRLLEAVGHADADARLFFVGDYVDRGPQSKQVVDLLLELPDAQFIRGNHDDIFDQILAGEAFALSNSEDERLIAFCSFLEHGLGETFGSYGVDSRDIAHAQRQMRFSGLRRLIDCVPQAHRDFFRNLPLIVQHPEFFLGHGRWDPRDADDGSMDRACAGVDRRRQSLLWGRFSAEEITGPKTWSRHGYFGHTPVLVYPQLLDGGIKPLSGPRITLLDTAAALRPDGLLTAWCHEHQAFIQVDARARQVRSTLR